MYANKYEKGFSLVSTVIGLGFIVAAIYYFQVSYTNAVKSRSKLEKTALGKNFLTIHALNMQSFSFDNLLQVTEKSAYNCEAAPRPVNVPEKGVLSLVRVWSNLDEKIDYCVDVKNFEFKESGKVLDISLIGYFRPHLGTTPPLKYFITFRKSK